MPLSKGSPFSVGRGPECAASRTKLARTAASAVVRTVTETDLPAKCAPIKDGRLKNARHCVLVSDVVDLMLNLLANLESTDNREAGSEVSFCNAAHTMVCCGGSDLRDECCDNEDYAQIDDRGVIVAFGSNTIPPVPRATVTAIPSSVDLGPEKTKLGVGLGVGLGVPLLLMCTMALLFFQRYRRLRANSSSLPEYPSTKETGIPLSAPAVSTKAPAQLDGRHVRPELATTEHLPQELQ